MYNAIHKKKKKERNKSSQLIWKALLMPWAPHFYPASGSAAEGEMEQLSGALGKDNLAGDLHKFMAGNEESFGSPLQNREL